MRASNRTSAGSRAAVQSDNPLNIQYLIDNLQAQIEFLQALQKEGLTTLTKEELRRRIQAEYETQPNN